MGLGVVYEFGIGVFTVSQARNGVSKRKDFDDCAGPIHAISLDLGDKSLARLFQQGGLWVRVVKAGVRQRFHQVLCGRITDQRREPERGSIRPATLLTILKAERGF